MNPTIQRILCTQISRDDADSITTETRYKSGYTTFIVKSHFNGPKGISDLLFDILIKENEDSNEHL